MPDHEDEPTLSRRKSLPSRTKRKHEAEAIFELGKQLAELAPTELDRIPLDDRLRREVDTGRKLSSRGARKRQLKLIGALLREAELEAIQAALAALSKPTVEGRAEQKGIERWRKKLLAEGEPGDAALTTFVERYQEVDRQRLRQLQRAARKPTSAEKGKKAAKELFQLVAAQLRED